MNRSTALRLSFFVLSMLFLACAANGQENKPPENEKRTTADETFTLNIAESHVTETAYQRSTEVGIGGATDNSAVEVRAGASVRAQNITITLRGVTGSVRFRASLEKLRRLFQ